MNYEEKILTILVDNYRNSKKDTRNNKIARRTKLKPNKVYGDYNSNKGDFDEIALLNTVIDSLVERKFITVEKEKFGTRVLSVYLEDAQISNIEAYLEGKYGYISKDSKLAQLKAIIDKYQNASLICSMECELLLKKFNKRQLPENLEKLDAIFKALEFIENNQEDLYIREVSMLIYGDSKDFENTTLKSVCTLLHKYSDTMELEKEKFVKNKRFEVEEKFEEDEKFYEILFRYHIYKSPQKICLKGPALITINGITSDISGFEDGIEFFASDLSRIDRIEMMVENFMTVENHTSYLRYRNNNIVLFSLGGFANRDQRNVIRKILEDNPNKTLMHFGDIDAGGFWIHQNLCEITGKEFKLFCMSERELSDSNYQECLHSLTENDINRLKELAKNKVYENVISYMLEHNVKLEQEIISYHLMKNF